MQIKKMGRAALIATALISLSPATASATTTTNRTTTTSERGGEGSEFPWGLLGLLGLAGLLGLRKKERDIHVDARRNP